MGENGTGRLTRLNEPALGGGLLQLILGDESTRQAEASRASPREVAVWLCMGM